MRSSKVATPCSCAICLIRSAISSAPLATQCGAEPTRARSQRSATAIVGRIGDHDVGGRDVAQHPVGGDGHGALASRLLEMRVDLGVLLLVPEAPGASSAGPSDTRSAARRSRRPRSTAVNASSGNRSRSRHLEQARAEHAGIAAGQPEDLVEAGPDQHGEQHADTASSLSRVLANSTSPFGPNRCLALAMQGQAAPLRMQALASEHEGLLRDQGQDDAERRQQQKGCDAGKHVEARARDQADQRAGRLQREQLVRLLQEGQRAPRRGRAPSRLQSPASATSRPTYRPKVVTSRDCATSPRRRACSSLCAVGSSERSWVVSLSCATATRRAARRRRRRPRSRGSPAASPPAAPGRRS